MRKPAYGWHVRAGVGNGALSGDMRAVCSLRRIIQGGLSKLSMRARIAFLHLGCAKNLVDAEVMAGHLATAGHCVVDEETTADVIIINTCGFIEEAREETISEIFRVLGRDGKDQPLLVLSGCLAQRYPGELAEGIPEIAGLVGVHDIDRIVEVIEAAIAGHGPVHAITETPRECARTQRYRWTPRHYAYLKIAEGCSRRCNYCAIPIIRGHYRSRQRELILAEARELVADGARELNLIAQDVTAYRDPGSGDGIGELLQELACMFPDVWIRLLYAHPDGVGEGLIETMLSHDNICSYLDIPLQHGSRRMLEAMGRPEDPDSVREFLLALRARHPGFVLRTTLMVGFPGEEERDFERLLDLVSRVQFDDAAVFTYSPEDGTPAYHYPDAVPLPVARERANILRRRVEEVSFAVKQRFVGDTMTVVIDESEGEGCLARHQGQAPEVDGMVYIPGRRARSGCAEGSRVSVEIESADSVDLWARPPCDA